LHARTPVGRPDVVFQSARVAVFVDGCFWHGCPEHYVRPRSRVDYWAGRLAENVARDRRQTHALTAAGWTVVRVWEHEVFTRIDEVCERIECDVRKRSGSFSQPREVVVCVDELDADARIERRVIERFDAPGDRREVVGPRVTAKWTPPKPQR
jgi:DNA mismatch endonuclease (patch repair protein)